MTVCAILMLKQHFSWVFCLLWMMRKSKRRYYFLAKQPPVFTAPRRAACCFPPSPRLRGTTRQPTGMVSMSMIRLPRNGNRGMNRFEVRGLEYKDGGRNAILPVLDMQSVQNQVHT